MRELIWQDAAGNPKNHALKDTDSVTVTGNTLIVFDANDDAVFGVRDYLFFEVKEA